MLLPTVLEMFSYNLRLANVQSEYIRETPMRYPYSLAGEQRVSIHQKLAE